MAELYERRRVVGNPMTLEEALDSYREEYSNEVSKYTEVTPNFDWWSWSGPYNGERDLERRYEIGLEQVEKFVAWSDNQVIWIAPDGTPGIELGFNIELDGIDVRGFIDAIVEDNNGNLRVRDYKTGNTPGDDFQLGVYALAVNEVYGVGIEVGDYFMAGKQGKPAGPTGTYDLRDWTREAVSARFAEVEEGIKAGRFDPDPEPSKCRFCDVSRSCPAFTGEA